MKYKKQILSVFLSVVLSVGVFSGVAYAASINAASELGGQDGDFFDFGNTTIKVGSLRVGSQGVGGVTFFNGSIVNDTKTYGHDNPVTIADNLRVDGGIQRGHNFPTDTWGVKILDSMTVYGGLTVNEAASFGGDVTIAGAFNSSAADAKYLSANNGYTKTEADAKFATQTDLALKADLTGVYGKSVLYTKTEVDNLLLLKANVADVYDTATADALLSAKADSANVYTQAQTNTLLDTYVPEAQTQHAIINGSDFVPEDPTASFCRDGITGVLVNRDGASNQIFLHTLNIPNGSTLDSVEIEYVDNDGTEDVVLNLWSSPIIGGFPVSVTSTGENSSSTNTKTISPAHVIDNTANQYMLVVSLPTETTGNLGCSGAGEIHGIIINYTTPTY